MKKEIFYPSAFLFNDNLDVFDKIVLIYLIAYYSLNKMISLNILHTAGLYEQIFNKQFSFLTPAQKTRFRKDIISALKNLKDEGFIKYSKREERDLFVIDKVVTEQEGSFLAFNLADVDLILRETESYILVFYFLCLLKSRDYRLIYCNKRGAVGHMPLGFFAKSLDRSIQSIMNYNKQLEDLGIIYIRHSIAKGVPNAYGLMEDKECVNAYFAQFSTHDKSKTVNRKRSLKQKYNASVENDELEYGAATMEEIEEYVKKQEEMFRNKNS